MTLALTLAILAAIQAAAPMPVQGGSIPAIAKLDATSMPPSSEPGPGGDTLAVSSLPDDRLTIAVAVGAEGPFRFLVDTGADRSAVSRQLADRLNLPAGRGARLHSVTGLSNVRTASVRGMRIASRTLPDVTAPLLDAAHVGADGILGTDVLRSSMVRFDFARKELSIAPSTLRARNSDPNTIVVEARRRSGRLIVTEAELDGQRLTVVLDTGTEVSIGNAALRLALARRHQLSEERPAILRSVTGSDLPATYMTTRQLDIGGVALRNLGIAFANAHTFKAMGIDKRPALLLGMNALQAFDSLTIDMAAKKLRFVMPAGAGRDGRFAASGILVTGG